MEDELKQIEAIISQEVWSPGDIVYFGPKERVLTLYGPISTETVLPVISQILELENRAPGKPIRLHMNTEGGSLSDALALYDALRAVTAPIITVATGICASAGLLILSAGDFRIATKNTLFFYHEPILPFDQIISQKQMEETSKAYTLCKSTYEDIIKGRIGINDKVWNKEFDGETLKYFTAKEALSFNFINEIMEDSTKTIKILE
jgi:ATP-dependent Clp protease protease subunit